MSDGGLLLRIILTSIFVAVIARKMLVLKSEANKEAGKDDLACGCCDILITLVIGSVFIIGVSILTGIWIL